MTKTQKNRRGGVRDLISLSASIFFVSSLPRCVAKSLELTVQEGIHTNIKEIKIN